MRPATGRSTTRPTAEQQFEDARIYRQLVADRDPADPVARWARIRLDKANRRARSRSRLWPDADDRD